MNVRLLIGLLATVLPTMAQAGSRTPPTAALPQATSPTTRSAPPTRDPRTPGFVTAKELPDGFVPPVDADGNFIIGPTHTPASETVVHEGVPRGAVYSFTMNSSDSQRFPGIARDSGTFGTVSSTDPATLVVTTSHPTPYTRRVAVYVPAQYIPGTSAPFIVGADGPDPLLFTALDNLIAQKRVPAMIAISIGNGGGDAQGSERALEYDTMSGRYAEFVETEVLPLVERQYNVKLTKDPEGRATMGGSSGGSAAFIMAWYHPELYHRVLAYSITAINQQWPHNAETPHGAWEFHERLIPNNPVKPIRVWMEVGDKDFLNPNVMRDGMHDWVVASENMARVLAAKGYHYQFVFARNAAHVDQRVKEQTLPEALEWLWRGYPIEGSKGASGAAPGRMRVLLDTDANNEVDDQHALAYMLFSGNAFDVVGITVNRTRGGGDIEKQAEEAERVVRLAGLEHRFVVTRGANGSFDEIARHVDQRDFDGAAAVDLIIRRAHESSGQPLVLLPIGKLTNIALALKKDPSIASKVRIVWLGSNYPEPGEYNQENDESALQYILDTNTPFEIVLVRYGAPSGTAVVRATREEIRAKMPGKGPRIKEPIVGRNGGQFTTFGDYSVDLFEHITLDGDPPSRALFDMAAVAIVKNPAWAHAVRIPSPRLVDGKWVARADNPRSIILWENFDRGAIMKDFYESMERPVLAR